MDEVRLGVTGLARCSIRAPQIGKLFGALRFQEGWAGALMGLYANFQYKVFNSLEIRS